MGSLSTVVSVQSITGFEDALVDDWHSAAYSALKVVALFLTAAVAFRFTQRRTIAQFTPFDWIAAVAVGAIVGRSATASDTSWLTAAAALFALILAHAIVNRLRFIPPFRRLIDPPVVMLIHNGEVDHRNLRRCGLTGNDLDAVLRQHGYLSAAEVGIAVFEAKGVVSVFGIQRATTAGESEDDAF